MKISILLWTALPIAFSVGCVSHHDLGYTNPTTPTAVVAPVSPRPAVRVYPDTAIAPRITTAPGEADDLTIANSIRNILARDTAHVYRNVDIAVNRGLVTLRGTVATEHSSFDLREQIASVPGVVSVDNQLGVDLR